MGFFETQRRPVDGPHPVTVRGGTEHSLTQAEARELFDRVTTAREHFERSIGSDTHTTVARIWEDGTMQVEVFTTTGLIYEEPTHIEARHRSSVIYDCHDLVYRSDVTELGSDITTLKSEKELLEDPGEDNG